MKLPLLIIVLILASVSTAAQAPQRCQAPTVRSFALGQPYSDLKWVMTYKWWNHEKPADEINFREVLFTRTTSKATLRQPSLVNGVSHIALGYIDDQLAAIKIHYDQSVKWKSNAQFTRAVATKLQLPIKGWSGREPSVLNCEGFIVATFHHHTGGTLLIKRSDFDKVIESREARWKMTKDVLEKTRRERFQP